MIMKTRAIILLFFAATSLLRSQSASDFEPKAAGKIPGRSIKRYIFVQNLPILNADSAMRLMSQPEKENFNYETLFAAVAVEPVADPITTPLFNVKQKEIKHERKNIYPTLGTRLPVHSFKRQSR